MDSTTSIKDLKKWLSATNLSKNQQKDFLERFEKEGKWTPKLAEEFAQAVTTSLDESIKELDSYSEEIIKRNSKLNKIESEMKSEYKRFVSKQQTELQKQKESTQEAIKNAQQAHSIARKKNTENEMNDILSNP